MVTAIQTRALAPSQPRACPSHWASLCPGGKCLLANSPSRFGGRGTVEEGKGGPVPLASLLSPPPAGRFAPPLGWVLCYRHWWVTGSPTQRYCCLHNRSSNSNKQFSLPKSDQIICLDTHPAPIPATRAGPMASCSAHSAVTKLGSTLFLAEGFRTKLFP